MQYTERIGIKLEISREDGGGILLDGASGSTGFGWTHAIPELVPNINS